MALIEKFGYDTKYASHLVRILKMGIELLKEETIKVKRLDAAFLLDVKNGKYKLEEIKIMVEDLMQQFKQAEQTTQLPDCSDYNKINNVLIDIIEDYFNKKKEEETRQ
jgi:polyhydroxyalkanoate synthesis regulator phasin